MCGIVAYFGPSGGVDPVLDALELLSYRAPDSTGLALLGPDGKLRIRRVVGTADLLRQQLEGNPLPPNSPRSVEIVTGHGRWAMVGEVSVANAHPISDMGRDRVICENGSHNATLMMSHLKIQEAWWRARGFPEEEKVHRTENSTEVLSYEWDRASIQSAEGELSPEFQELSRKLDLHRIQDSEERALRTAMSRLHEGNASACACYSRYSPDALFVTSHNKPIAIVRRTDSTGRQAVMVASDVNAALMLWPRKLVTSAAGSGESETAGADFSVDVLFLDHELNDGKELFAKISHQVGEEPLFPTVALSLFDGTPLPFRWQRLQLNPAVAAARTFPSYTESHIAEIPDVMDRIRSASVHAGSIDLSRAPAIGGRSRSRLRLEEVRRHFGPELKRLRRLLLVGEGSSWRSGLAALPLYHALLPSLAIDLFRPVELLNLGAELEPETTMAVEISWSGTTDSLLKVDKWLGRMGLCRLAVTGRPHSDLARRTGDSAGVLDVRTGIERSVATTKGYQGILMMLDLLALQLAQLRAGADTGQMAGFTTELTVTIPDQVRTLLGDEERRLRIGEITGRFRRFNKVALVGDGAAVVEGELKVEELAQVVAMALPFDSSTIRPLIDRSARTTSPEHQILFIVNATSAATHRKAEPLLELLAASKLPYIVHTTSHERRAGWEQLPGAHLFASPQSLELLQPLIDAIFFFEVAVALAYARGLTPHEIDQPRNLAKSVTTTGAEPRSDVERRQDYLDISMAAFSARKGGRSRQRPGDIQWRFILEGSQRSRPLEEVDRVRQQLEEVEFRHFRRLLIVSEDVNLKYGTEIAASAWREITGTDLVGGPSSLLPVEDAETAVVRLPARDTPSPASKQVPPLAEPLVWAYHLIWLALEQTEMPGGARDEWRAAVDRLPELVQEILEDEALAKGVEAALDPFVNAGYDKVQLIGGGQDHIAASHGARVLRRHGFLAEPLYTDSAWHGPLAAVGGPDAHHDALIVVLANDPLFQAAALVDTQVYRARHAPVLLLVPEGLGRSAGVAGSGATALFDIPPVPRPLSPFASIPFCHLLAQSISRLWTRRLLSTRITRLLDSNGVAYRLLPHAEPVFTVEAAAAQRGVAPREMVKSILLRESSRHRYVMACVTGPSRLDPQAVRSHLSGEWKRLSFASAAEIEEVTGFIRGAVAPLGLPPHIPVLFDEEIRSCRRVNISSGDPMAGLELDPQQLIRLARATIAPIVKTSSKRV